MRWCSTTQTTCVTVVLPSLFQRSFADAQDDVGEALRFTRPPCPRTPNFCAKPIGHKKQLASRTLSLVSETLTKHPAKTHICSAPMHDSSSCKDDARRSLESYRSGETGITFEILCRFARPIFDLFGLNPRSSGDGLEEDIVDDHVAALETARLFWAFFESRGPRDQSMSARLQAVLFGPDPTVEEQAAMAVLIERLSSNWQTLPHGVREKQSGRPSFYGLIVELEEHRGSTHAPGSPATNGRAGRDVPVDSPEALAEFACPLLEDPAVEDNPDRLSEMMGRAHDYWQLATMTGNEYADRVERLADKYSATAEERDAIVEEANLMVARFHKLFPHWT